MSQQVHADTDGYTTRWDDDIGTVVHSWKTYVDGETFRAGADAMIEVAEKHGGRNILIDHRNMKLVDKEDQEWIRGDWIPRAVEAGATFHVVVHQESTLAEMNLDEVIDLEDYDYESRMTSDMDQARQWIANR